MPLPLPLLSIDRVSFAYEHAGGGNRKVLAGVSLAVSPGEIVSVVGQNGAGKSTLLRLAAGLLPAGSGSIRIDGVDPWAAPRRVLARQLAYLPQDYHLVFPFTVVEVVLMGRYPYRSPWALEDDEDLRSAMAALRRCDIEHLASRRFDAISGGERRRALLAQAFCQAARLILLDEPTASLDPAHALAVFRSLVEEKATRNAAALIATHDLSLAARFSDRLIVLASGQVAATGRPTEVLQAEEAVRAFGVALHVGYLPDGSPFVVW
ncbi:MAG: ABC transporter ATP-binding protein [Pseudomonadota bacterium]